jgi:hypothetical protein
MEPRTLGAINLGPTGNIQGGHKFYNLATGEMMVQWKWTELHVPSEVILRLQELSKDPNYNVEEITEANKEENEEENGNNSQ